MRIIAGKFRSRVIEAPRGTDTRPTLDQVRESVFSILMNDIVDDSFLDLYAGSGANGLEALSRGAKRAVFVDKDRQAQRVIQKNIESLDVMDQATLLRVSAKQALDILAGQSFDLVYLDPPYRKQENVWIIKQLVEKELLNSNSIIMIEADRADRYPEKIEDQKLWKKKEYGRSQLLFYRKEII